MSKRLWLLGVVVLVSVGLLMACGTKYNSSSNGLLLVGSQGSSVIETFSFSLNNGHISALSNPAPTNGQPFAMVMDPAGAYAYVIIDQTIASFKVKSDGTVSAAGQATPLKQATVQVCVTDSNQVNQLVSETVSVTPVALTMDSKGKFLFVSDGTTIDSAHRTAPGAISVFAVGSNGGLQEYTNADPTKSSPFTVPASCVNSPNNLVALAVTPTVFPAIGVNGVQNAVCSAAGTSPPTSEYLYAVDSVNNLVWEFAVDTTSGALGTPVPNAPVPSFVADQIPVAVAVDPCDRFVYVSDSLSNKVSAYTICNGMVTQGPNCPHTPDGSLEPVSSSPFSLSGTNGAGPLVVDPYGNNVYVLGTLSNTVAGLKISPSSGGLAPLSPATVATGSQPKAMAIRGDDNWLFVANYGAATVSQFSITPATGALSLLPTIQTDNSPWGVAVK